jgi:Mn2+/Fe2+ NRAMP family transporter
MLKRLQSMGPGVLVAAAFIGPGTVTACTLAGANYGYALLWALLFATIATVILQEMSARLGTVTQLGLGEVLQQTLASSIWRWPSLVLIVLALYGGNAAYEAGNLAGAALGVEAIFGDRPLLFPLSIVALAAVAGAILWLGNYRQIERFLIALVALMGLAFVCTFVAVRPDLGSIAKGLFQPQIPDGSLLTIIALIGTTVVPYNLFLHASAAKQRWAGSEQLGAARSDTIISIGLGGLLAILVVSTAAASMFTHQLSVQSAADMAVQFEPLFGAASRYLLGVGLFAAGLSSAITAPLATGFALCELFNWSSQQRSTAFRIISLSILCIGTGVSLIGIKPLQLILLAQFANGLLLPLMAGFLIFVLNQRKVLGDYANGWLANSLGAAVMLLALALGLRLIARSFGLM